MATAVLVVGTPAALFAAPISHPHEQAAIHSTDPHVPRLATTGTTITMRIAIGIGITIGGITTRPWPVTVGWGGAPRLRHRPPRLINMSASDGSLKPQRGQLRAAR